MSAVLLDWLTQLGAISGDARSEMTKLALLYRWDLRSFGSEVIEPEIRPILLQDALTGREWALLKRTWLRDFGKHGWHRDLLDNDIMYRRPRYDVLKSMQRNGFVPEPGTAALPPAGSQSPRIEAHRFPGTSHSKTITVKRGRLPGEGVREGRHETLKDRDARVTSGMASAHAEENSEDVKQPWYDAWLEGRHIRIKPEERSRWPARKGREEYGSGDEEEYYALVDPAVFSSV